MVLDYLSTHLPTEGSIPFHSTRPWRLAACSAGSLVLRFIRSYEVFPCVDMWVVLLWFPLVDSVSYELFPFPAMDLMCLPVENCNLFSHCFLSILFVSRMIQLMKLHRLVNKSSSIVQE